jgi:hypothetical protein
METLHLEQCTYIKSFNVYARKDLGSKSLQDMQKNKYPMTARKVITTEGYTGKTLGSTKGQK